MPRRKLTRRTFLAVVGAAAAGGYTWQARRSTASAKFDGHPRLGGRPGQVSAQASQLPVRVFVPGLANDSDRQRQFSVARLWDEEILAAIRIDNPRPPVHARNLYHLSAAMWDAWAAYHPTAVQLFHNERAAGADIAAARDEAISYAAYRLIRLRYEKSPGASVTLASLDGRFASLGYDASKVSTSGKMPASLGNRIFETVRTLGLADGANEAGNYAPPGGYTPVNPPLDLLEPGTTMVDPNRWQSLEFPSFVQQNGIPLGSTLQTFVCPHWAKVRSFAIPQTTPPQPYLDPGPPPRLGTATDAQARAEFTQIVRYSSQLDTSDGLTIDISPGAMLNNPLGTNDGSGHALNPVTSQPYTRNVVERADYARVLAEYWADGPQSETPPGHWNVLANRVSDDPRTLKRVGGAEAVADDLEWDVKLYLALNGAVHDAAIGAWGLKGKYDSSRPISVIRYLTGLGQASDTAMPSYNAGGIELVPGLVEVVTPGSSQPGGRHARLAAQIGQIAVRSWRGQPADPATQVGGVGWILGARWMPYQKSNFVTPAFAAYTSGHSTFSRAAAEVLAAFTGSPFFPGGLGTATFQAHDFLSVESGPSQAVELQWATYYDAADQAGISRLFGGIHIPSDDFAGRVMGSRLGKDAYARARSLF